MAEEKETNTKDKTATVQKIVDMLNEGQGVNEVVENAGVSQAYVYRIKNRYEKEILKMDETEETEWDGFVQSIKIKPEKKMLTENNNENKGKEKNTEDYQCGSCGHVFEGDSGTFQRFCPGCGIELA